MMEDLPRIPKPMCSVLSLGYMRPLVWGGVKGLMNWEQGIKQAKLSVAVLLALRG